MIGPLDPGNVTLESPAVSTSGPSAVEAKVLNNIAGDERLAEVLEQVSLCILTITHLHSTYTQQIEESPEMALETLANVTSNSSSAGGEVELVAAAYLLSVISTVLGDDTVELAVSKVRQTL